MAQAKVRLHVEHPLGPGQAVPLTEAQANYLFSVMRMGPGSGVALFNGRDGEWTARVVQATRRGGTLTCEVLAAPLRMPPDVWLIFAPLKKARTDFVVEKAVELGAARILPVQTRFTNAERIRQDKMRAHAVEAAEQCGTTFVPEVADLQPLDRLLDHWPAGRRLLWCDEGLAEAATPLPGDLPGRGAAPWAILIGPEGGFHSDEAGRLRRMPQVVPIGLGPRILRAETAAVAALTLWQSRWGDWA